MAKVVTRPRKPRAKKTDGENVESKTEIRADRDMVLRGKIFMKGDVIPEEIAKSLAK